MIRNKQKTKLVSILFALLITGFLLTSLTSYYVSRESLRSKISSNDLPLTSDNVYSEIQRDLLSPVFIASLMASDTFLRDWVLSGETEEKQITKYLKEIQTQYKTFTSFFVSEKSRTYYHADGTLKKILITEERDNWYFRVREMKEDFEINVDPDLANDDALTIFINYKVFDYDKNYIGATGVGLRISAVMKLIEHYQAKYSRTIYFIDREGNVKLACSGFDKTVKNVSKFDHFTLFQDGIKSMKESAFTYSKDGQRFYANIRYIDEFDWFLVVEQAEKDSIKQIFSVFIMNLAICIVITILVLFIVNLSTTAYQKRIETLRGIVPICSYCKQIRDDKGYWNQVEAYVAKHTDAKFSHSICPACHTKHIEDSTKH